MAVGPTTLARALRSTRRRLEATAEFVRHAPQAAVNAVANTTPAEAATWARDLLLPYEHPLAEPPPGSGLQPVLGSAGLPLVGGILDMTGDRIAYLERAHERYGAMWWLQAAGERIVLVASPDAAKQVLLNADKDFSNDGWQRLIGPFFDRGLMLLSFGEHLDHRRIMQSAFHPQKLRGYLAGMDARITADLEASWPRTGDITLYGRMKDLAMRVAAGVFLGMELDTGQRRRILKGFHAQARAGTNFLRLDLPLSLWGHGRDGYDQVTEMFRREIPARRDSDGDDLFTAMVHASDRDGARFTDDEIVRHMNFLWFAAHDTTTLAMAMMGWAFGAHPEWQQRAFEESAAIGDGPLQPDDLDKLVTIDLVMKEVMRLWPPVPAMLRQTVRDVNLDGHYLPKGTYLGVMNPMTHRLPEYWTAPDTFDPSRFEAPREEHKQHSHLYFPFGAGAHKCIGFAFAEIETKAMWHRLLLTRRFSVADGYVPTMGWKALPEPLDDLPVTIAPR